MKITKILPIAALLFIGLSSCEDDVVEKQEPVVANTVENLPADVGQGVDPTTGRPQFSGKYTFFSFKDNQIVPESDSASTNWDIGLKGTTIITNGGVSGPGQGGAYVANGIFGEMKTIDASASFAADSNESLAIPTGSGNGWYNYNPQNNEISPIAGKVIFVRTADGNFAKMEILSYYKDRPTIITPTTAGRYYTFRYVYQPDGSKTFE
jgi:hypothetical protein